MTDVVAEYQVALRNYESAKTRALETIKLVEDVGSALRDQLPSFMGWQYQAGLEIPPGQKYNPKAKFDMNKWPDAQSLRSALMEWKGAFDEVRRAWSAIPEDRQFGVVTPPKVMETR